MLLIKRSYHCVLLIKNAETMKATTGKPIMSTTKRMYPAIITERCDDHENKRYEIGIEIKKDSEDWVIVWIEIPKEKFEQIFKQQEEKTLKR